MLFVPHLVPTVRGVLITCYAPSTGDATAEELTAVLAEVYAGSPFVRVLPPGGMADPKRVARLQRVRAPGRSPTRGPAPAIVVGALDNLVKGAAGQAIQNMNLMFGFDEATGLPATGAVPVSVTYPRGFRAVRHHGRVSSRAAGPTSGCWWPTPAPRPRALFTTNSFAAGAGRLGPPAARRPAAPARCVVNSGQANAATGPRGLDDASLTAAEAAAAASASIRSPSCRARPA